MSGARTTGVKSWDETYMMMAHDIASMRSKDPCTQVGAFIADREHRPLSMGYNGTPRGWDDASFPWGKDDDNAMNTKYPFVVHAERNAILNAPAGTRSLKRGDHVCDPVPMRGVRQGDSAGGDQQSGVWGDEAER